MRKTIRHASAQTPLQKLVSHLLFDGIGCMDYGYSVPCVWYSVYCMVYDVQYVVCGGYKVFGA
ncbi:hypothetical protein EON63_09810 [archaeon]|nr:MAG: hypothetical protein EON63_09810 [archaeon]